LNTHRQVRIIDPRTKKEKIVFVRSEDTKKKIFEERLGSYLTEKVREEEDIKACFENRNQIIVSPYSIAREVIATHLRSTSGSYQALTGSQLLERFLRSKEDAIDNSYLSGFETTEQFYLLFSYSESKNGRLADLVNEIISLRVHLGKHGWLFVPRTIGELSSQWGENLLSLSHLPVKDLRALSYKNLDLGTRTSVYAQKDKISPEDTVKEDFRFSGSKKAKK
jgi:hypothetical protein